ncbi:MAG: KpsF/GutQ family sugar-phosphate isomerase [Thermodesulfovibrionales bacterium]|nr:KpsF/GutQ family sugar-phosphate isomerase [Thermodesulfovibrionales bacterium]
MNNDVKEIAKKVLNIESEAVKSLADRIDDNFALVIKTLLDCKGRVVVTGMGKSGLVGKKIAATLASTGTPAFFLHPAEASHGDLGMVTSRDIVIALSNSGETKEILDLIPFLKRFGLKLIALTGNPNSTLATSADINLNVSVSQEACDINLIPTASTTAAMAMGDAIAVALLSKRGFKEQDFAFLHPGGTIGKKLFIKVKDLMHTGDDLPIVAPHCPMSQVVIEISSKRLGMAVVTDETWKILGIITDGDVRRGIGKYGKDFFDMQVGEVMTKSPKLIDEEDLAVKALNIMEQYSITTLLVPDKNGCIKGVIHLHDILKQGIV